MPLFLAGLLSRDGVLPGRLVEEALQRQVLAGGALDSSLLELGAIDEAQLGAYLARASGLPLANVDQLALPEQRLRRLFPLRLAERHGLVPFAQGERTLQMACAYPADAALLEEMGFLLSQRIEAWVAPEFRVRLAIERLYGHPASARMHELARRCGAEVSTAQLPPADKPPVDPERCVAPDWTVAEALARLEAATDRDEAIGVALRFGRRTFSYVALFGIVGGNAVGWDAVGEEPGAEHRVEQVVQPLSDETVLATVVRTQGRYLGPLARTEANERLVERMGRPVPRSAFVHPVEVGGRLVALVWADNGAAAVPAEAAGDAMVVVQTLGQTLERLVRERKAAIAASGDVLAPVAAATPTPVGTAAAPAAGAATIAPPAASPGATTVAPPAAAPTAGVTAASSSTVDAIPAPPAVDAPSRKPERAPATPAPAAAAPVRPTAADAQQDTNPSGPAADEELPSVPGPYPGAETAAERAAASPAGKATTDRFLRKGARSVAITGLQQACRGAESLLHAASDAERAEALARIAGSGSIGAEVLVALLPGPLRTDTSGALSGGVVLDALAALGPWAVPALSRAASSPSSAVRYWVAVLLASSADPTGHAALSRLASDSDPHVAAVARTAVQPAA